MTLLDTRPDTDRDGPAAPAAPVEAASGPAGDDEPRPTLTTRGVALTVAAWSAVLLAVALAVMYPLGPLFQQRDQEKLLAGFRGEVQRAADAEEGLAGLLAAEDPVAPEVGQATAILDLGRLRVQQVVVEGVGASQTRQGPGHVPGTAGLGQPGNSVVVGRRSGWGGPFDRLRALRPGDEVVATTVQGQSVYVVETVGVRRLEPDELFGPSDDDRLTLVTSASRAPWSRDRAIVVEAVMDGRPFEPTPQGGRTAADNGRTGDSSAWVSVALFGGAFAAAAAASVVLYRRWRPVTAYLLTTPALVVTAILTAESLLRLLPAWA